METPPAPCTPPSAPAGLSLWARSAKRDPVYRVHNPGVYQVGILGRTLRGRGWVRLGSLFPPPCPSLHCIPDELVL